jgi:CheY-like chemotaxis protein
MPVRDLTWQSAWGSRVFLASDASQGFDLAKRLGFSVALIDLDLKGKDGLLLIEQMRESFPHLPIIAISRALTGKDLEKAKKLGVAEVLQKPITPDWKPLVERVAERASS